VIGFLGRYTLAWQRIAEQADEGDPTMSSSSSNQADATGFNGLVYGTVDYAV
jgi:hypothetical protein